MVGFWFSVQTLYRKSGNAKVRPALPASAQNAVPTEARKHRDTEARKHSTTRPYPMNRSRWYTARVVSTSRWQ